MMTCFVSLDRSENIVYTILYISVLIMLTLFGTDLFQILHISASVRKLGRGEPIEVTEICP